MPINVEDLLSYGIEWDINQKTSKCKRIGNLAYHKSLPIQSQMKGCVLDCINKKVVYWLDEDDWNYCQNPSTVIPDYADITETYVNIKFNPAKVSKPTTIERCLQIQYIKINGIPIKVNIEQSTTYTDYVKFNVYSTNDNYKYVKELASHLSDCVIELGSILNGYDGEVFIHIPKYYLKSYNNTDNDGKKWVKISEVKIDDSWTESPECYISAYFNVVPYKIYTNMGYLNGFTTSTPLLSIANNTVKGAGTVSGNEYDNSDIFQTLYGKPYYCRNINDYILSAKQGYKEVLNYTQYKNLVWLYCIEYANFDAQEDYIEELTPEGYKQGGLGVGCSIGLSQSVTGSFNNNNPITPCGYGDALGNKSGIIPAHISKINKTIYIPRYRGIDNLWGDREYVLAGITVYANNNDQVEIRIKNNPEDYTSNTNYSYRFFLPYMKGYVSDIDIHQNGEIITVKKVSSSRNDGMFGTDYLYNDNITHFNDTRQIQIGGSPNDTMTSGLFNYNFSAPYNTSPYIKCLSIVTV